MLSNDAYQRMGLLLMKKSTFIRNVKARDALTRICGMATKSPSSTPSDSPSAENFLDSASASYIEDMYHTWTSNPEAVHKSWDSFFRSVQVGKRPGEAYTSPFSLAPFVPASAGLSASSSEGFRSLVDHLSVQLIIRSFQSRGHHVANLDPLGISTIHLDETVPPELKLSSYNLSTKDLTRQFVLPQSTFIGGSQTSLTLKEILDRLKHVYCNHVGIEYMHIAQFERQSWLRERFETPHIADLTPEDKKLLLQRLIRSSKFESFLARKWPSEKRFGLEGCEVMVPALMQMIDKSSALGVESFVIGMPHRGRLNVLSNVLRQPLGTIFDQFQTLEPEGEGSGDVKYHLGVCRKRYNRHSEKEIEIALVANPSHLEVVCPVVLGKTKSHQFYANDKDGSKTMAILLHGDAAFSGQGVVYETFDLSQLPNYTCHGNIHIVVNNQIGFTTDPRFSRSSPYCTDVGRVIHCPIFHVNADDPEAVIHVINVAAEWRHRFKRDAIIDLVGYRRYGHSEIDEPMFTQPLMYTRIRQKKPVLDVYKEKLLEEGVVNDQYVKDEINSYNQILEEAYSTAKKDTTIKFSDWIDSPWKDFYEETDDKKMLALPSTGVSEDVLKKVGKTICEYPSDFNIHPGLARFLRLRMEMVHKRVTDWALGEAFAFGTLLTEGVHVRLSGQDSERGAFSHRHYVLHDQKVDMKTYVALNHVTPDQAEYTVCNSPLNEFGVLSFEVGYSLTNPNSLVCWEAQFGDFSNVAQCVIDQFISSGEDKWMRQCGIVLMLPHGFEGMGPEHSTARLERFLQMSNDDERKISPAISDQHFEMEQLFHSNWIVANCTTPANYFHILRRQICLPFRKPLVLMTPKSLLRHPQARSPFDDYLPGSKFHRLIAEKPHLVDTGGVEKLIFCSGKVYYELAKERDAQQTNDRIVIARLEQLSPFPYDLIQKEAVKYPNAKLIWAQEEPLNMGAWTYVHPRFRTVFDKTRDIEFAGREASASTATGNVYLYREEQCKVIASALDLQFDNLKTMKME